MKKLIYLAIPIAFFAFTATASAQLVTNGDFEAPSVKISQEVSTCQGGVYEVSYAWSPRPGHADNQIEVYWGGVLLDTHSGSGVGNPNTVWKVETKSGLNPTGSATLLEFREVGTPDSLGMFLDSVSVVQTNECPPPPPPQG